MYISCNDIQNALPDKCNKRPDVYYFEPFSQINEHISSLISTSKERVLLFSHFSNETIFKEFYYDAFKSLSNKNVKISIITEQNKNLMNILKEVGISNITNGNVGAGFVVIDSKAIVFDYLLMGNFDNDNQKQKAYYYEFDDCETGVDDLTNFFNYQWRLLSNNNYKIAPISAHSRTSAVKPLKISNGNSSLFFLSGFKGSAPPISVSIFDYLPLVISDTDDNISIFVNDVIEPSTNKFSLYSILNRFLIISDGSNQLSINYQQKMFFNF